jgi:hypothetical protein
LNAGKSYDKTKDLAPFDIDLWASFGDYTVGGPTSFDCHVGITKKHCGGLVFNGDSIDKKNGKSSESITFDVIGAYNYLIFFNRWYKKLPTVPTPTNWISDIALFLPVIKYYSSESDLPEDV